MTLQGRAALRLQHLIIVRAVKAPGGAGMTALVMKVKGAGHVVVLEARHIRVAGLSWLDNRWVWLIDRASTTTEKI